MKAFLENNNIEYVSRTRKVFTLEEIIKFLNDVSDLIYLIKKIVDYLSKKCGLYRRSRKSNIY